MLSHPRPTDLAGDTIRVFRRRELENQDQVGLIDLRDVSGECAPASTTSCTSSCAACMVASATGSRRRR